MKTVAARLVAFSVHFLVLLIIGPIAGDRPAWGADRESLRDSAVDGRWGEVFAMPDPRYRHTAVYDPVGDRMVAFGGDGAGDNGAWALSLAGTPVWHRLGTAGTPPPVLSAHAAIYDPVRRRMIVTSGGTNDRTWALSLSGTPTWSELRQVSSKPPPARQFAGAIYDPVRDRLVLCGGHSVYTGDFNDVWALSLSGDPEWTCLSATMGTTCPSARTRASVVYDPLRDRMLMFGGAHWIYDFDETWALDLAGPTWRLLPASGTLPPAQGGHSAIYDAPRDRMVVFGGNKAWSLSLTGVPVWSSLDPSGTPPSSRVEQSAVFDPVRSRMVIFAGYPTNDELWGLSLSGAPCWKRIEPQGFPPPGLASYSAIRDPVRDEIVTFGGWHDRYVHLNETWTFSFHGSPVWRHVMPAGTRPTERRSNTAVYDPVRDRMVVFGGWDGAVRLRDTWVLSLGEAPAWTELVTAGPVPGRRSSHTAILDSIRDRMVVFGGPEDNAIWTLSLAEPSTWSVLDVEGTPPPGLTNHVSIHDPVRDRMVVFGGAYSGQSVNDTWTLSFAGTPTWSHLDPAGAWPPAQTGYKGIYDPVRDRLVVFGTEALSPMETWALPLHGEPVWDRLDPTGTIPDRCGGFAAVYEPERDAMWIFGGSFYGTPPFDKTWELAWDSPAPGERTALRAESSFDGSALALRVSPNPLRSSAAISFRAAAGDRATVRVFDVCGRLVATIRDGAAGDGVRHASWNAAGLPGGVYFVRVQAGADVSTAKVTLLR